MADPSGAAIDAPRLDVDAIGRATDPTSVGRDDLSRA